MGRRIVYAFWLIVIFLVGLSARIYLEKYTYIFGFDSYWFARMVSYIIRYGSLPPYDPLTFRGFEPVPVTWELSMEFPAWAYRFLYGDGYDRMQLLNVFKWLPAVFGAFGSVIVAVLTTVLAGPFAGILAGIFAATNPGYVYRTLGGFLEDDATAFLIVLAVLFAALAYLAKNRRMFLACAALSSVFMLAAAISWQGFYIIPYSVVVFVGLWAVYHIAAYISRFLDRDVFKRYEPYIVVFSSGILGLVACFIIQFLARKEAADALYLTGALSLTTVYTLALSPLSAAFWGIFAATAVLAFHRRNHVYGYISVAALFLALLTVTSVADRTYVLNITLPDGTDVQRAFKLGTYGAALLGSLLVVLAGQLAGVVVAFLFLHKGEERFSVDWKLLAVIFVPLIFASLSCYINGMCWFSGVTNTILKILNPPETVSASDGDEIVRPYTGFIEPLTAGPTALIIGEETVGFMNWPAKFGVLFALAVISIPFVAYRVRVNRFFLFILAWAALTWWASWYKLKFAYYFGIPVAIISALVLSDAYSWAKRRGLAAKTVVASIILLVSLSMVATGIFHTVSKVPSLITSGEAREMYMFAAEPADDYLELFSWIEKNTPEDANLLNWWSIGHWLTFFTERGVMTDNTNARIEAGYEAARFFLFDENTAYNIAKKRGMNYVIVESSLLWGSRTLALYAYEFPDLSDPRVNNYHIFPLFCVYSDNVPYKGKYLCTDGEGTLVAVVDANTWAKIPPFGPGYYQTNDTAARLRMGKEEFVVYNAGSTFVGGQRREILLALTPKLNESTLVKMLLHAPLEHFKYLWSSKKGEILVYKVM